MYYTYVESTETLMGQGSKKGLLNLPKEWFENMWGQNSLFRIAKTKETKLSLMRQFVWTLGTLLGPLKGVFIIEPDGSRKEKESSKPLKGVMIEHEGGEFIPYHYNLKV